MLCDQAVDDVSFSVVRVDGLDPVTWTVLSRHEWWSEEADCASAALAILVDARRVNLPVCISRRGGVAIATQLFDSPLELVHDSPTWDTFEQAVRWLMMEA